MTIRLWSPGYMYAVVNLFTNKSTKYK